MEASIASPIEVLSIWLYQTRVARGLSQETVALRAGIAVPTYGRLERAGLSHSRTKVTLDTMLRLVAALEPDSVELGTLLNSLGLNPDIRSLLHGRAERKSGSVLGP